MQDQPLAVLTQGFFVEFEDEILSCLKWPVSYHPDREGWKRWVPLRCRCIAHFKLISSGTRRGGKSCFRLETLVRDKGWILEDHSFGQCCQR